jgi:hypothetical protein
VRRDFLFQFSGKVDHDIAFYVGQPMLMRIANEVFAGARKIIN